MKIKTRKQKLMQYNEIYPNRVYNPEKCVRDYFEQRGWNLEKASKKAATKLEKILDSREYESIKIVLYEYPMKTDRPRHTKTGRTYSPNAADNHKYFEKAIKKVCQDFKLINTPTEVQIDAYLEMPKQVPPDEVILFEAKVLDVVDKPDYDNIGKCYTDIQNDVLLCDDDIVHIGIVRKFYSVLPRVEITITYLKTHESDYVYKKIKNRKTVKEAIAAGRLELHKLT